MGDNFYIKYFDKNEKQEVERPLEKIVETLLAMEINASFHIETLKAQAIIIRTNLLRSCKVLGGKGNIELEIKPLEEYIDIWKEEYKHNREKINKAVKNTTNMAITFNDKLIDAKYQLACGGSTENAENVIDNQVVYLRRVLCNYCIDSPYWQCEKSFTIEEIEDLLDIKFPKENINFNSEILGFIEEIEKDEQGRVLSIKIGDNRFSGKEARELLGLNSTRFNIFPTGIKFVSRGKGHGLGLCQYGAERMAKEGYTFIDILKYYYTGVEIGKIKLPCINEPLFGKKLVIDPGHGGEDIGHKGNLLGLLEKNIALKLSLKLKRELEDLGATIHLTREKDEKVLVMERLDKANNIYPDFFISLHVDYYPNSNMKGSEIFYFRDDIESKTLGNLILKKLKENQIPTRAIREGNYYIFRGIKVSSLMIELGYLSNDKEEANFQDEDYMDRMVKGIKEGILAYYEN